MKIKERKDTWMPYWAYKAGWTLEEWNRYKKKYEG